MSDKILQLQQLYLNYKEMKAKSNIFLYYDFIHFPCFTIYYKLDNIGVKSNVFFKSVYLNAIIFFKYFASE